MYKDKRILGIIPARGGSKGIKNKNIIDLAGKPLIAYSIKCGLKSKYIDDVVVTTDSEKIAEVAREYGAWVPFLRPAELALDTSTTLEAVLHAVSTLEDLGKSYDTLVLLQPTQPLRTVEDIDGAVETFFNKDEKSLVSVSLVDDHPLFTRTISDSGEMDKLLKVSSTCRRQDMPPFYKINGCIYINKISELNEFTSFNDNIIPFVMKKESAVDIDEPIDLVLAEYSLKKGQNKGDNKWL